MDRYVVTVSFMTAGLVMPEVAHPHYGRMGMATAINIDIIILFV